VLWSEHLSARRQKLFVNCSLSGVTKFQSWECAREMCNWPLEERYMRQMSKCCALGNQNCSFWKWLHDVVDVTLVLHLRETWTFCYVDHWRWKRRFFSKVRGADMDMLSVVRTTNIRRTLFIELLCQNQFYWNVRPLVSMEIPWYQHSRLAIIVTYSCIWLHIVFILWELCPICGEDGYLYLGNEQNKNTC
jgi:hypothetical protein